VSDAPETKVDLVRRSYALWNAGGVEALVEHVVAPDVVFYDLPDVPDTGIFRGVEAYADRLRAITEALGDFQFEVGSIEERSDYTLATVS
jgi:ketosteroid isomerase-like protein